MQFDLTAWLTSPYILMLFAIVTGLLVGKIQIKSFNLGASGCLFTGLIVGWAVYQYGCSLPDNPSAKKMLDSGIISTNFFNLFLIFFVAAVGLLAAKDMLAVLKKYGGKFVALGLLITLIGAGVTYGMTLMISGTSPYKVSGVYTGALTSSPGLAAAIETAEKHAAEQVELYETLDAQGKKKILLVLREEGLTPENTGSLTAEQKKNYIQNASADVGIGYAVGYPFGVIIVIMAMTLFPKIFRLQLESEKERFRKEMEHARSMVKVKEIKEGKFDLAAFAFVCIVGYTVGCIGIYMGPLGYVSLSSTGGVLICALIFGQIGKIGFMNFRMDTKVLGVIRQLSLAFFLAIVGLRYGHSVFEAVTGSAFYLAAVSLVVGISAMLIGFFVGKYLMGINWIMLSGAICGGMTSTPGLGAAVDAAGSDDPASGYAATYPFALFGMVLFTIILHLLPTQF